MINVNEENLISTLEYSLRQFQTAQTRLQKDVQSLEVKKSEIEEEIICLRNEIQALQTSAAKTEEALKSLIPTMRSNRE